MRAGPAVRKLAVGPQVEPGGDGDFGGIRREAALEARRAQRFRLHREAGVFVVQCAPADHHPIGGGAQLVDALFVASGGDGGAASLEGVDLSIGGGGHVHAHEGTVHALILSEPGWRSADC